MDKQLRNKLFFRFCKYLFRVSLFGLYVAAFNSKPLSVYAFDVGNNSSSTAPVARLEDWRFSPETSQLEISLSAAAQPRYFYLSQPSRIVIDLPGTKLGRIPTKQNFYGAIQSIRVSQLNADVTRIVMDLAPGTFIAPNQVQLQPVSRNNPNRWVLRPLVASSSGNSLPQGYLSPAPRNPSNFSPTTITPPLPSNTPLGIYNPPQPSGNLPSATYNSPQPPSHSPLGIYNNPPQPSNNPSVGVYNPPQSPGSPQPGMYNNYPQPPNNLPSATYNQQQVPDFSVPPPLTTLPATTNNFPQTPSVQVPPLSRNNPSQLSDSAFPAPSFPYQRSHSNHRVPAVGESNFPVPTVPNASTRFPNSGVIEFGEPFPNSTR
ncbi:AMIN domain-containing protein [Brasilonema sp. UFV-L1]|uniref:AMIN domain-containing protein n=1 Tax=Brasilonema sp. UFV-L1 TaxID=2234130 RepID=UPI00145CC4DA|nr:AMIN domain-containing protein [Brasilonema sp. UFV-L1]NMG06991.1 AMIN domain-containing protein [Brasilonema sp. UFV-L1]